ncbi:MAG: hypothetical protein ACM3O4_05630 [Ignavibacteriales bacterium]
MHIYGITKQQFKRLEPLKLEKGITSIESDLYILPGNQNGHKQLLKYYRKTEGEYFGNKLLTINSLIDNKNNIGIEELVLPDKLAIVDKKVVGFIMNYIENSINLITLLNSNINTGEKIKLLKQVQRIISKIQYLKLNPQFLLGDIHESNFILNTSDNRVYAVDLDGCKISNNQIYSMKYCSFNEKLFDFPHKYPLDENDNPIPNVNTEWYCFTTIVLNTISNGPLYKLLLEDFYEYLCFLRSKGISNELLDCFCNLYSSADNYQPGELLDAIPEDISNMSLNKFLTKTKKKEFYKPFLK